MLELIDKALRYAANQHDGQTRKDSQHTPYVYHPAMTGFYLQHYGMDEELVAAAILHDTVEDTEATLEEIHELFGEHVHYLVKCSTEDKTKSWEERKEAQHNGIRRSPCEAVGFPTKETLCVSESALFVKLADKLHNISCTLEEIQAGTHSFDRMNRGRDKQEWYYRGLVDAFETRPEIAQHPMFTEFKEKVSTVFKK